MNIRSVTCRCFAGGEITEPTQVIGRFAETRSELICSCASSKLFSVITRGFTRKQGLVQVRLERVNSHVEIVVSDNGSGISPDFLPHIFERFRQADSATTREHGGIGLGLAIVRHLVELHGGTIHAESGGRDTGSTFRVRLPLMIVHRQEPVERRVHPTTDTAPVSGELPDLTGLVVLAVDDDTDARALVCETLEMRGARVTAVDSAEKTLDSLGRTRADVLIADIGMARSDGFE
jgi:hypothetical protein